MRILLLFALASCGRLHGQDGTILVKAGKSFSESFALTDLYQYEQFTPGKVYFKAGDSTTAKLNYNKLMDAMQFIDFKGDTLKITNGAMIKFVSINKDVFYFKEGDAFVNLIKDTNEIKLAAKQTLTLQRRDKIGAYGVASPTSSITNYSSLISQTNVYNLVPREDLTFNRTTEYYVGDKYNRFVLANKKNLLQQFPKQNKALNTFLKDNNIHFNKKEDMEKLLAFLAGLPDH